MDKNIRYKPFSIRLHEDTKEWLLKEKGVNGKSWNRFIIDLLKEYGNASMRKMPRK